MKVSSKVECGILAMLDIALYSDRNETVNVSKTAARQNISVKYLEQILPALRQARLIRSVKGPKGGYRTAKSAASITLREVIDALDVTVLGNVEFSEKDQNSTLKDVVQKLLWDEMTELLQQCAEKITLADLMEEYQKVSEESLIYYI
ncbi:MAG: Rrf2 family transcriptional regulator [Ruminococcus sp.]|nr:Rrf2 family transcriptional regulator [Ruminococcus sp.]